jgi:AmmeMemoRadiSam system protein B
VLIGPNHFGLGHTVATFASGSWETPLSPVRINARLVHALTSCCPEIIDDPEAHAAEHALEVQLPFLQYLRPDVTFRAPALGGMWPQLRKMAVLRRTR